MRILLDHNVPIGAREFLAGHEVFTILEMQWPPQIENGDLIKAAEASAFDILVTSDQNIRYQQDLTQRRLAFVVLGSNIWPVVRNHGRAIAAAIENATAGTYQFVEMLLPKKPQERSRKQ